MGIGVTLLTWGTFTSYPLPDNFRLYWGLCSQKSNDCPRRHSKGFIKPNVMASACHFELFDTTNTQKKKGTALLAEVIHSDYREEVALLLIIGTGRHTWIWNSENSFWCFPFPVTILKGKLQQLQPDKTKVTWSSTTQAGRSRLLHGAGSGHEHERQPRGRKVLNEWQKRQIMSISHGLRINCNSPH